MSELIRINPKVGPPGPAGPKGDPLRPDASGPFVDRALYDAQLENFAFLATDQSPAQMYFKLSDVSGDWSGGIPFQGPVGPEGPQGIQGVQGNPGPTGPEGPSGIRGRSVLNGAGAPATTTGEPGDFYIDTTADEYYGPKGNDDTWGLSTPLVGPVGPAGPTGATGPEGPTGPTGLTGPAGPEGPTGPAGADGTNWAPNATGTFAERANYDAQLKNFAFFAHDEGNLYVKASDATADWSAAIPYEGPVGPQGNVGPQGVPGPGLPVGGTVGQTVRKKSLTDYDTEWVSPADNTRVSAFVINNVSLASAASVTTGDLRGLGTPPIPAEAKGVWLMVLASSTSVAHLGADAADAAPTGFSPRLTVPASTNSGLLAVPFGTGTNAGKVTLLALNAAMSGIYAWPVRWWS